MKRWFTFLIIGLLFWPAITQAAPQAVRGLLQANNIVVLRTPVLNPTGVTLEAQPPNFGIVPLDSVSPLGIILPLDRPRFIILPDGSFALAVDGVLHVVDGDGTVVHSVDFFQSINGLEMGPNGEIIVMTDQDIILWDLDGDQKTATFNIADGTNPCLMPNDVLAFSVGSTIQFLDLNSGKIVREVPSPKNFDMQSLARRADGNIAIIATNFLWLFDSELENALAGPVPVPGSRPKATFLPNGNLLIVADSSLIELDGATLDTITAVDPSSNTIMVGAAVMPHRFEADIAGFLAQNDGTVIKIKAPALVSWTPGSGRTVLQMGSPEAAKLLGDTLAYLGSEGDDFGEKGQRLVAGSQTLRTRSSFGADATGFIGTNNYYFADGFNGQIQAAQSANVLVGTANSKTLLNGLILPLD